MTFRVHVGRQTAAWFYVIVNIYVMFLGFLIDIAVIVKFLYSSEF